MVHTQDAQVPCGTAASDFADEVICDEKGYIANWLGVKDRFRRRSSGTGKVRLRFATDISMKWNEQSMPTFENSVAFRSKPWTRRDLG